MAIPKYDDLTRPLLELLGDGRMRHTRELADSLSDRFKLTEEERNDLLPSRGQTFMMNRTGWAGFHLQQAGLVSRPKRAFWQITDAGKKVLQEPSKKLDRQELMRFAEFAAFMKKRSKLRGRADDQQAINGDQSDAPPEEVIADAFKVLRSALKDELLSVVRKIAPIRFERLVLDLLVAMGYGGSREEAARMTKISNDEGIDGVINEDRLGLDVIYVQAKRWQNAVGRKEIQSFVGALAGQQAQKGVFITTGEFAETARDYARKVAQKVILIGGDRLAELMIEHNIGISLLHAYEIKRLDSDYFEDS